MKLNKTNHATFTFIKNRAKIFGPVNTEKQHENTHAQSQRKHTYMQTFLACEKYSLRDIGHLEITTKLYY